MRDLRELALSIDTPSGRVIVVGCSHPGVESVLKAAASDPAPVRLLVGGFHWVTMPVPQIREMSEALRQDYKVQFVAPGHCTGEAAFKALQAVFGTHYLYAGVGTVIELPRATAVKP